MYYTISIITIYYLINILIFISISYQKTKNKPRNFTDHSDNMISLINDDVLNEPLLNEVF